MTIPTQLSQKQIISCQLIRTYVKCYMMKTDPAEIE